jgi:peroxiredoxin
LAGFAEHVDAYDDADVQIVALSADGEEGARKMQEEEGLSFPVLYGLDVDEMKEKLGLYIEHGDRDHLQPAQFILRPGGVVALACYSSGAVGRLRADEALDRVGILRDKAADDG